jgi:multicomponent Na+:H+ antiporter subunit G
VSAALSAYVADALVLLALAVMTIGVVGIARFDDALDQIHAASKAVVLGTVALAVAALAADTAGIAPRVVLLIAFLLLTTPVAAHAIARAAWLDEGRSESERDRDVRPGSSTAPSAPDESRSG